MKAIHILAHNATQEALFVQLDQRHMGGCWYSLGDVGGLALAGPGLLVCLELPFSWTCIGIGILVEPPGWHTLCLETWIWGGGEAILACLSQCGANFPYV